MITMNMLRAAIFIAIYSFVFLTIGAILTGTFCVTHFVLVPLLFKYSTGFRRKVVFANFVNRPSFLINYNKPSKYGLKGGRNFYIEYDSKVDNCKINIGVWHILPISAVDSAMEQSDVEDDSVDEMFNEEMIKSRKPIILYCHGNAKNRATSHRAQLYKFFQKMDFHIVTFDYRGYGDSTNIAPSEMGVVEDALIVYDWVITTISKAENPPPIYIWGHSLGTAISSELVGNLNELSRTLLDLDRPLPLPSALFLEAPFNNMADEIKEIPICMLVSWIPYFESSFVKPFHREFTFKSDEYLCRVNDLPILILHAKDDMIVPYSLGLKLYNKVNTNRSEIVGRTAKVELHAFEKSERLGHKWIVLAKNLDNIIRDFLASVNVNEKDGRVYVN